MINFIHKWLNPHCPDCKLDEVDARTCDSCETLKTELASVRYEKEQLLKSLLQQFAPKEVAKEIEQEVKLPINTNMTWRVRKNMLEAEDRKVAQIQREQKLEAVEATKPTKELEKELLG